MTDTRPRAEGPARLPAVASRADGSAGIRRRIRRMRVAAVGRVDPASVYCLLLAIAMAAALVQRPVVALAWPARPDRPSVLLLAGAALVLLGFRTVLRQVGPLVVSRADATWLLPAPVPRRTLLTPALLLTAFAATVLGGVVGLAVAGRVAARPATAYAVLAGLVGGAAAALLLAVLTLHGQRGPRLGRLLDLLAGGVAAALVVVVVAGRLAGGYPPLDASTPASIALTVAGVALAVAVGALVWVWWRLDDWPTHRIVEASATTGSYADAVYAVEPSFLAEQSARRYWRRRTGVRASGLLRAGRMPPLVATDLLHVRRRPARWGWAVATATAPALLADGPVWLLVGVVAVGALAAASATGEATHADAANPGLPRLLGLTARRVRAQRLVVPTGIAAVWSVLALGLLQVAGVLAGPWWALGVAAAPAVAVAALWRAKASAASVGTIFVDTPLGAFPTGMLLWLANGVDVVAVLALPVWVALATVPAPEQLDWRWVAAQAALSAVSCAVLVLRPSAARTVGV